MDWRRFQEPSTDGAPGIYTVEEALRYQSQGKWPTIPPTVPSWVKRGPDGALPSMQSEWTLGKGWVDGKPYATLDAYLRSAGGAFVRTGPATRYNAARQLVTDGPNVLRLDHDPVTGVALGARLEGQTTNLWRIDPKIRNLYTADADERGIPLRQFTGDGVTASNWYDGNDRFADNVIATASIHAKRGTSRYIMLGFTGGTTTTANNAAFDFDAGDFVYVGSAIEAFARYLGGGLWRPWIRNKAPLTNATIRGLAVRPSDGNGNNQTYILQPGETVIWGAPQVEVGSYPTSYTAPPLDGTVGVRMADNLSFARPGTPEGTVVIRGRTAPGVSTVSQCLWQWDAGPLNRHFIVRRTSRVMTYVIAVNGVSVVTLDMVAVADNTDFSVAVSWKSGQAAASLNGAAAVVNTTYSGDLPAVTTMLIGRSHDFNQAWFGTIASLRLLPKAYDPAQLPGILS